MVVFCYSASDQFKDVLYFILLSPVQWYYAEYCGAIIYALCFEQFAVSLQNLKCHLMPHEQLVHFR
jgi:hypothetical protein